MWQDVGPSRRYHGESGKMPAMTHGVSVSGHNFINPVSRVTNDHSFFVSLKGINIIRGDYNGKNSASFS